MHKGQIVQYDTPENILKYPANDFVTEFVGRNRIWESPEYIRAKDIMIEEVITCSRDLTLSRALEMMRSNKVNSLMVMDKEKGNMEGLVKPSQISKIKDRTIEVGDIMIKEFEFASPEDSVVDILKVIDENNISEIPVIDNQDKLLGLITKNTLIITLSEQYLEEEMI